ncbi:MAG: divergent PAP2 family protein [Candidatus Paceibacterota bacterium]
MNEIIAAVWENKALISVALAWFIAQTLKAVVLAAKDKKFRFNLYSLPGGFPSSHSATSVALATVVGLLYGFGSPLFAICVVLAFYIIYDARVIRAEAGRQAQSLNRLIEILSSESDEAEDMEKVKEVLGHSLKEILAGSLIGIIIALLVVYGI